MGREECYNCGDIRRRGDMGICDICEYNWLCDNCGDVCYNCKEEHERRHTCSICETIDDGITEENTVCFSCGEHFCHKCKPTNLFEYKDRLIYMCLDCLDL